MLLQIVCMKSSIIDYNDTCRYNHYITIKLINNKK